MARPRSAKQPLPPALPPDRRTVGQLVAETLRFYGSHFWASLLLGVGPAVLTLVIAELDTTAQRFAVSLSLGALVLTLSYVAGCLLVAPEGASSNIRAAVVAGLLA